MLNLSHYNTQKILFKMKTWSDNPIHEEFCIKFFLDTMILVYIIDETHKSLTSFLNLLSKNPFTRIVSSSFVIYEFIGVRKREHYIRTAADNFIKQNTGNINYGSLFYNIDYFKNPNAKFEDEVEKIKEAVNIEIQKIKTEFNIDIEYSAFHEEQLQPARDVCLSSKLANQDSLVLISSVFPQPSKNREVIILTNDNNFSAWFAEGKVPDILKNLNLCSPTFLKLNNIPNIKLIGKESMTQEEIKLEINPLLFNLISKKLEKKFIGKTFVPTGENFPINCICFKLIQNRPLSNGKKGVYVSILSKNLDFIYTSKKPVRFWNNGVEIEDGFIAQPNNQNISYRIIDIDDDGNEIPVLDEIIEALKVEGNHVFIHPDSPEI